MKWRDKKYKRPDTICCSAAIVPVLKDDWMYCPACGRPKPRSWLTQGKVVSNWLNRYAWWPTKVAGFWLWLEHYELCISLTGVNSSAGGFEFTNIEYKRLIPDILAVESKEVL